MYRSVLSHSHVVCKRGKALMCVRLECGAMQVDGYAPRRPFRCGQRGAKSAVSAKQRRSAGGERKLRGASGERNLRSALRETCGQRFEICGQREAAAKCWTPPPANLGTMGQGKGSVTRRGLKK